MSIAGNQDRLQDWVFEGWSSRGKMFEGRRVTEKFCTASEGEGRTCSPSRVLRFQEVLLLRGFARPLLGPSHQNIFTCISQSVLPSIFQFSTFQAPPTSLEMLERHCVDWLVLSSIQQDLNSASITTIATLQFHAIQQLY